MVKTKIVLDADVIIHFAKGELLSRLPSIFPAYKYVVLDDVYAEICGNLKVQLDNQIAKLKNISRVSFNITGELRQQMAYLRRNLGRGESACMLFCKENHDVLGSSNLKDIVGYCNEHQITYLTTFDFLYYAIKNKVITISEARQFVVDVKNAGSILPSYDIAKHICQVQM